MVKPKIRIGERGLHVLVEVEIVGTLRLILKTDCILDFYDIVYISSIIKKLISIFILDACDFIF
jgi:hypothetical protein